MTSTPHYDRGFRDGIEEAAQACERFAAKLKEFTPGAREREQISAALGLAVAIRMIQPPSD